MIWVVLAALSLPIWFVIGGLLGALWNRRKVRRTPNAFPCKTRSLSAEDGSGKWGRATANARSIHDVLVVNRRLALAHSDALPVRDVQGPVTRRSGVKLHGGEPVSIRRSLDRGSLVEDAAPASSTPLLSGRFLAFEAKRVEEASF